MFCTQLMRVVSLIFLLSIYTLASYAQERRLYWGEQHVHTSWSFDAFAFGNQSTGPEDFYRYARGEAITHPGGFEVKISKPLDWGAVTDHAEYMGMIQQAQDPQSALRQYSGFTSRLLDFGADTDPLLAFKLLSLGIAKGVTVDAMTDPDVVAPVWQKVVDAAEKYYQPGEFTTFAAYEWTSTPNSMNMHRNIFFRDASKVPRVPFTPLESTHPRDLWEWMDSQRARGNDVLAVSHNGNLSSGLMFPRYTDLAGRPLDSNWAEARLRNEPLTELKQGKGQSETTPFLSPDDGFANFEVFVWRLLGAEGDPVQYGSYARQAYRDGLAMGQGLGFNPFRFGMVAGSDSHVTAVPYRKENYFGMHGTLDDSPEKRISGAAEMGLNSLWVSPAGLSAVWAEENTREAIFDALRRKETYATTGVRIAVRFFGGWDFDKGLLENRNWVQRAYQRGVPMGGELPARRATAPSFAIWATRDPDSANLDRVQVVKGWSRNGQSFEKVYDVAWAGKRVPDEANGEVPAIGSTVNLAEGTYSNSIGSDDLRVVWTDPDFDPGVGAFYYLRVLEIPTPRWSTIQAAALGRLPPSGAGFTAIVQERAWSSPIWYSPDEQDRADVAPSTTVADLQRRGAAPLNDAELRALVVGNTVAVRNLVTGQRLEILYGTGGRRLVTAVDGQAVSTEGLGMMSHGAAAQYQIRDGQLFTSLGGAELGVTVYRLGGRLVAAADSEFGFANYEVEAGAEE